MLDRSDLHDYQHTAIRHIQENDRCAVWMAVGGGKSVTTLTALDDLSLVESDVWPALVIGTKRIAKSVWPQEPSEWGHIAHLTVSAIVGDADERRAALRRKAQVYSINYENLAWLVDLLKEDWPFRTVIADESTKLKSVRTEQGAKNAGALRDIIVGGKRGSRSLSDKVRRMINLTGTPAPNGLKDLWGQTYLLDAGARLGTSYEAFTQRWFRTGYDGYSMEPMPHAEKEIHAKLRDICLTVDVPPVEDAITNDIYVDLPPAARRIYKEMEDKMYAEIEEIGVEAFSAASRSSKCLAIGTDILTHTGWKSIENYEQGDLLWDGEEWVSASELVCNGVLLVVECWGVRMTPDHRVLTKGGWREAQEVLLAQSSERYERPDVRLSDYHGPSAVDADERDFRDRDVDGTLYLRDRDRREGQLPSEKDAWAAEIVRLPTARDASECVGNSWDDPFASVGLLGQHAISMPKSKRQGLVKLWGSRDQGLRALGRLLRGVLGGHGAGVSGRFDHRTDRQQRPVRAEKLSLGYPRGAGQQHSAKRAGSNPKRGDDNRRGFEGFQHQGSHPAPKTSQGLGYGKIGLATKVYDIINAGPRNRFTVRGDNGEVFLAHNCEQIANGAVYYDDEKNWKKLHDAKLEALEDIIEESNGAPVLVGYQFKHDLACLKAAFPKGTMFDDKTETIDKWNRGETQLMFGHPASMGHGLNMARGGNVLARFGFDWNLENYDQIIGRIGPRRQKQAGLNRAVFDHRVLARNTVDELKRDRVTSKRSVQDLLLESCRRRKG